MTDQNPKPKPHCLLIEDDEEIREVLNETIRDTLRVQSVGDGLAAIELLMAKKFDVVICDINLPLVNGPGILEEMMAKNINTPVIFISGALEASVVRKVTDLGAHAILEKPFPTRELLSIIDKLFKKAS